MLRLLIPLLLSAPAAGCGLLLDFDPPDVTASVTDGAVPASDASPSDAAVPAPDAGTDAGRDAGADGSMDGTVGPPDAAADGGDDAGDVPDAGADAGPPFGCADGTVEQTYAAAMDMVGCDGAETQCAAEALCAPGWHLCTWAVFRSRGGDATPATASRWLAGCLRMACGSSPVGPGSAACTACDPGVGAPLELSYSCDAAERARPEIACNVGVAAAAMPWHLVSRSLECAMAGAEPAHRLFGATCCR